MAEDSKIKVMISSRCSDDFSSSINVELSEIRTELKSLIEGVRMFDKQVFSVWINEESTPLPLNRDSWEHCMAQANDCHIFICLFNGNPGWDLGTNNIGICHAELMTAYNSTPGKVRIISIPTTSEVPEEKKQLFDNFRNYYTQINAFRQSVASITDLVKAVQHTLHESLVSLAISGVRESSKGRYHLGDALDWARLNYNDRCDIMIRTAQDFTKNICHNHAFENKSCLEINDSYIYVRIGAIPDSLSISKAKEKVGQPFLSDFNCIGNLSDTIIGPFHIILCYKSITENQARSIVGYPDIEIVKAPFGIFLADNIHKTQIAFISNCRDKTNLLHGMARFIEWIKQSQEGSLIKARAISRKKIVSLIAAEQSSSD